MNTTHTGLSVSLSVYSGPFMGSTGEFRRVQCQNIIMIRNPSGRIEVYYLIDGLEAFRGYSEEVTIRQGASLLCLDLLGHYEAGSESERALARLAWGGSPRLAPVGPAGLPHRSVYA